MTNGKYAVVHATELLALPAAPGAEVKRELLGEFLQNPFLDDDLQSLTLRLGVSREEAAEALAGLCQEGLLMEVGRGYRLDLEPLETASLAATPAISPEALIALAPEEVEEIVQAASSGEPEESAETPLGIILMGAGGRPELVDKQAAAWLGVSPEELDGAAFEAITGFDPGRVLEGTPKISFCLQQPRPLEVSMQACQLAGASGVLVVLQDLTLQAEAARINAHVQEELFARLHGEMAEPMLLIQQFLDIPDSKGLGQARAALEQVNAFLEEFMLSGNPGTKLPGDSEKG